MCIRDSVRGAYAYQGKYLLNATFRRDASSKFAPANRWANSGSIGAGWIVSDEQFLESVKAINFFKLKASYGTVTNSNGVADNLYPVSYTHLYYTDCYANSRTNYITGAKTA